MLDELDLLGAITDQLEIEDEENNHNLNEEEENTNTNMMLMDMFEIESNRRTLKVKIEGGRGFKYDIHSRDGSSKDKFFVSLCGLEQRGRTNSYSVELFKNQFALSEVCNFRVDPQSG